MNLFLNVSIEESILCIVFFILLISMSAFDLFQKRIPNILCILLLILGIISCYFFRDISLISHGLGAIIISVPLLIIKAITNKKIGSGDIKLIACCGLFLGWELILLGTFIGMLFSGIYIIISLITKNPDIKQGFPLGPALSLGMIFSSMIGSQLLCLI